MSDPVFPHGIDLPLDVKARVDSLCLEFDDLWRRNGAAEIAPFLSRIEPAARPVLFVELLVLDATHRRSHGLPCARADYEQQFPEHRVDIEVAFARLAELNVVSDRAPLTQRVRRLGFRSGVASGVGIGLIAVLVMLAIPHRHETDRAEIQDKLETIGLAFQMHHDSFGYFAQPRAIEHGTELSWRVDLLPFLGHQQLYNQFHLREPWDSPHNRQLLDLMPDVFRIGGEQGHLTRIQVVTGPGSIFDRRARPRYALITDGAANTILAIATSSDAAVPWTQPDERDSIQSVFEGSRSSGLECLMADGQLLSLPSGTSSEVFKGLASPNGGELIDASKLRQQFGPHRQPTTSNLQQVQDTAAAQSKRMTQMKQLALAMHNYHDTHRQFPLAGPLQNASGDTSLKLSWRVQLLPYLDQRPLYDKFHLNEPWDSPHNLALLPQMPDIFASPDSLQAATTTRMLLLTGAGTPFDETAPVRFRDFIDGTQSTILIVESGRDKAVPWTKPQDITFDAANPVACLGQYDTPGFMVATVDGAVRHLKTSVPPDLFRPLATPSGNEVVSGELQNFGLWR